VNLRISPPRLQEAVCLDGLAAQNAHRRGDDGDAERSGRAVLHGSRVEEQLCK
jgi:hypothetical protein